MSLIENINISSGHNGLDILLKQRDEIETKTWDGETPVRLESLDTKIIALANDLKISNDIRIKLGVPLENLIITISNGSPWIT